MGRVGRLFSAANHGQGGPRARVTRLLAELDRLAEGGPVPHVLNLFGVGGGLNLQTPTHTGDRTLSTGRQRRAGVSRLAPAAVQAPGAGAGGGGRTVGCVSRPREARLH